MKVKAVEISRGIKKARQEGRAFLSYIDKSEEEENLPSVNSTRSVLGVPALNFDHRFQNP